MREDASGQEGFRRGSDQPQCALRQRRGVLEKRDIRDILPRREKKERLTEHIRQREVDRAHQAIQHDDPYRGPSFPWLLSHLSDEPERESTRGRDLTVRLRTEARPHASKKAKDRTRAQWSVPLVVRSKEVSGFQPACLHSATSLAVILLRALPRVFLKSLGSPSAPRGRPSSNPTTAAIHACHSNPTIKDLQSQLVGVQSLAVGGRRFEAMPDCGCVFFRRLLYDL
ncbi:MAG: hypothetical protein FRX49_05026 [Trebouxia sp. A1-2]|nr:MAG: hypothetical protein FRX49_05026 [Trebouxia sp. A1-2]